MVGPSSTAATRDISMPHREEKPRGGQLRERDKERNTELSRLRAPVERLIAHFQSWRILHADYDAFGAARSLFFFSISWGFE